MERIYPVLRTTIFLLFAHACFGQEDRYIGLVSFTLGTHTFSLPPDTSATTKFITVRTLKDVNANDYISDTNRYDFYATPNSAAYTHRISSYFHWQLPERRGMFVEKDSLGWLRGLHEDLDGGDLILTCKSRQGDWLEVVTDEATQQTLWIKTSKFVKLIPWKKLGKQKDWWKLMLRLQENQLMYDKPGGTVPIAHTGQVFEIVGARGDWMKVSNENAEYTDRGEGEKTVKGWIRFRKENKLIVKPEIL